MSIAQLRAIALHHAEQASHHSTAAAALGGGGSAQEFREKADWHRESAEQLNALANEFTALVANLTGREG